MSVVLKDLNKTYPPRMTFRNLLTFSRGEEEEALRDLNLEIERGEIFGFLGPNGSGKTTLLRIASTSLLPTSGSVRILGYDVTKEPGKIKPLIGFLSSQERSFYWRLSGFQNLMFFGRFNGLSTDQTRCRARDLIERFDLGEHASKQFKDYSSGVKQRFGLCRALLHKPSVLILDEPTRSVDTKATEDILTFIKELSLEKNITVVLATHNLNETSTICDRFGVLKEGRLIRDDSPETLKKMCERGVYHIKTDDITEKIKEDDRILDFSRRESEYELKVLPSGTIGDFLNFISKNDVGIIDCQKTDISLAKAIEQILEGEDKE